VILDRIEGKAVRSEKKLTGWIGMGYRQRIG